MTSIRLTHRFSHQQIVHPVKQRQIRLALQHIGQHIAPNEVRDIQQAVSTVLGFKLVLFFHEAAVLDHQSIQLDPNHRQPGLTLLRQPHRLEIVQVTDRTLQHLNRFIVLPLRTDLFRIHQTIVRQDPLRTVIIKLTMKPPTRMDAGRQLQGIGGIQAPGQGHFMIASQVITQRGSDRLNQLDQDMVISRKERASVVILNDAGHILDHPVLDVQECSIGHQPTVTSQGIGE